MLTPGKSFTVDGYDTATKTVYEYQGCYFHSCRKCFPNQRHETRNCHTDRTVEEKYQATLKKTAILRAAGYTVIEKCGCEFAKDKKTDPELQLFLKSFELVPPMDQRDAFFGKRTGATTLYARAENGEEVDYKDFTSLYPSIKKYGTYPVGFPETHFNPADQNIFNYFGIAQVDILTPEHLFSLR